MPTYNDCGIVLHSKNLAESDKILNIYTKKNGLVRAVAKGVKKLRSSFGRKVNQLSCCHFQFAKGKNLDVISDCSQINGFTLLRSDLIRLTYGILFIEIVSSFAREMESESSNVYELLYSSLNELQKTNSPDLLSVKFIMGFLSLHGLSPQFETCVSCSTGVKEFTGSKNVFYSSALGGLLCKKCADFIDHKVISSNVIEMLKDIKNQNFLHWAGQAQPLQALNFLREHVNIRAKKEIKTFDLMFSL